ncbi:MAG TPA: nucleotidyl transferase AbiEii/AbiGii toxin family protein [Bdellovibrionota bacterium]|nr:nucleotidyl transferase AbiEii/AbiGii toxin family protein [Bdellovibrionota bacterium]
MNIALIQDRLREYACATSLEEECATKEIVQEVCLAALSRAGFFRKAVFQGGTALRVLYQLPRFSEDLDFILKAPDRKFVMDKFLRKVVEELNDYGFRFEFQDRSRVDENVRKAFLKDDSWASILTFQHLAPRSTRPKKIQIKIEVDTNPPDGSVSEGRILDYPFPFTIVVQDMPSLLAGKSHALLCRPFIKGRDWYDFLWYARKRTQPNLTFLKNALYQTGPWKGLNVDVTSDWYYDSMEKRIEAIDWDEAKRDIRRFLRAIEIPSIDLWNRSFFQQQLTKMRRS